MGAKDAGLTLLINTYGRYYVHMDAFRINH